MGYESNNKCHQDTIYIDFFFLWSIIYPSKGGVVVFDNIGGKLKIWARICFAVLVVCSIIGAIVLWCHTESVYQGQYAYPRYKDVHPWVAQGFGVLIGGVLTAWISSAMLYAYGEFVENSATLVSQNSQIIRLIEKTIPNSGEEQTTSSQTSVSNSHFSLSSLSHNGETNHSPWKCKQCGTDNPGSAITCQGCGLR